MHEPAFGSPECALPPDSQEAAASAETEAMKREMEERQGAVQDLKAHAMEVGSLERELLTYLQSTLDIAERINKLAPSRRMSLVFTKLEEAQMRAERR